MSETIQLQLPAASTAHGGAPLRLEALFEPALRGAAQSAAVIAPPHPLYGGRMDNPVVEALALGLRRSGWDTLRFNFRGCGDSEGVPSGELADGDADYGAALAYLVARGALRVCAAGYSFGAGTALRALSREPRIARGVVVAPPVAMLALERWVGFGGAVDILVGDDDAYAPLDRLELALAGRPNARVHVLADTDHFFSQGTSSLLSQVERVARSAAA